MSDKTSITEMQTQARDALTRAAERICDPARWSQWYVALDAAGEDATWGWRESAVKWSAFGAVEREMQCETPKRRYAHACMYAASKELYPHRNGVPEVDEVNMLEGHAAAVALLRRAAEIAADPESPRVLNPLREVVVAVPGGASMSLKLCDPLGGDWPFWPRCARCDAEITEGQRYAILPGTNTIWCASCAGAPVAAEKPAAVPRGRPAGAVDTFGMPRSEREGVARRRGFAPLPPGRWSRDYERCQTCGTTERQYQANGLCRTCWQRARGNDRPPMSASGRTCRECGRDDRPHKGQGLCSACWQTARRQRQEAAS